LGGLPAIVFGNTNRLEALRVLVAVESRGKYRKTIAAVSVVALSYIAFPSSRVDDGPDVAPSLIFWRRSGCEREWLGCLGLPTGGGCRLPSVAWLPAAPSLLLR
jgi:hypothetical protein